MSKPLYRKQLHTAQVAINTLGTEALGDDIGGKAESTSVVCVFGAGTSAGAVVVETAHDPAYAGTWANLATIAWSAASKAEKAVILGNFIALRVRISVAIVGGSVDTHLAVSGG